VHVIAQKVPEPAALAVLAEAGVDFVQARILRPPEPLPST
jgi:EAL domain-containing protein (putative c-di-GMP-specific phosphodiesterase class I)